MESEFQPGSRGRVLRNLLGITRVREMEAAETQLPGVAQRAALRMYGPSHRFTPTDIRRLHRMWLGFLSLLMASQAGLQSMDFSALAGRGKRTYVQAIQAAMSRDYAPLETLFARVIQRRRASSSTDELLDGCGPIGALALGEGVPDPLDR